MQQKSILKQKAGTEKNKNFLNTNQTDNNQHNNSNMQNNYNRPSFQHHKKAAHRKPALTGGEHNFTLIQAATDLSIQEIEELHKQFVRYDVKKIDSIRYDEIDDVYRDMGLQINENHKQKILQEMQKIDKSYADFKQVCELFVIIKKVIEHEIDEANNADFVNAFAALGGNPDRTGLVNKNHIIEIVKNEFELTFDIQRFLGKRGVTKDEMNYQDFCALFEHGDDLTQDILSLFSYKSKGNDEVQNGPNSRRPSFEINYKNYNRWCSYDYNILEHNQEDSRQKKKKNRKTYKDFLKSPTQSQQSPKSDKNQEQLIQEEEVNTIKKIQK